MSKLRGHAEQEAKKVFKKELEKCMIDTEIRSKTELAERMNMDPRTLYRRFEDLGELRVIDLINLVKILCPNPIFLLRLLGYSNKKIRDSLVGLDKCV